VSSLFSWRYSDLLSQVVCLVSLLALTLTLKHARTELLFLAESYSFFVWVGQTALTCILDCFLHAFLLFTVLPYPVLFHLSAKLFHTPRGFEVDGAVSTHSPPITFFPFLIFAFAALLFPSTFFYAKFFLPGANVFSSPLPREDLLHCVPRPLVRSVYIPFRCGVLLPVRTATSCLFCSLLGVCDALGSIGKLVSIGALLFSAFFFRPSFFERSVL